MTAIQEPTMAAEVARQLEAEFLGGLENAQTAYERIVEMEAWTDLGFERFADWWAERVQPTMRALSMRPTREIAASVVERVREEEAELPPAQRRTQRELAEMVGLERSSLANRNGSRSSQREESHGSDLGEPEQSAAHEDEDEDEEPPLPGMPAGQERAEPSMAGEDAVESAEGGVPPSPFAGEFDRRLAKAQERKAAVDEHNARVADLRKDITPEREAQIVESVRHVVEFKRLVATCEEFIERLALVDLDYAARGVGHADDEPIRVVIDRAANLANLLEANGE